MKTAALIQPLKDNEETLGESVDRETYQYSCSSSTHILLPAEAFFCFLTRHLQVKASRRKNKGWGGLRDVQAAPANEDRTYVKFVGEIISFYPF